MSPAKLLSAASLLSLVAWSVGCWQLTGVSDFKVEEKAVCTPPEGSPCRVAPNCGCADTETCQLVDVNANGACAPDGTIGENEPCTARTDCGHGLACVGGTCARYCATNAECTAPQQCVGLSLGGTNVTGAGICGTI